MNSRTGTGDPADRAIPGGSRPPHRE